MKLLMISGDRSILRGKKGAFWNTLEEFSKHWERIDVICPWTESSKSEIRSSKEVRNSNFSIKKGFQSFDIPSNLELRISDFPNVYFHPSPRGLWYQPWWILMKGSELTSLHHHEVMTVHEFPPFYNGIGAQWLHRSTKIPYALEIHHIVGVPVAVSVSEWIGRILSRFYLPFDCRRASKIRTVNHAVKALLIRWGVRHEKISVVPSFYLDHKLLKPDSTIEKKFDLVFSGRLVRNKGLPELLHAVARMPQVTLLVIGDGPERARAERRANKLGIGDRVKFTGWLPDSRQVCEAIQLAKVFVMNSRSEGGPRVALEAMALGMPLIATSVGLMPEIIRTGENGILITSSQRHLIDATQHLLEHEELRTIMGRKAAKIVEKFERVKLIEHYAAFLKGIASSHSELS